MSGVERSGAIGRGSERITLYHAISSKGERDFENLNERIRALLGEGKHPKLFSSSRTLGNVIKWGDIGIILEVPKKRIVGFYSSDAGTPTDPVETKDELARVIKFYLNRGGYYHPPLGPGSYDEVVFHGGKDIKIKGVFYRDPRDKLSAEVFAAMLAFYLKKLSMHANLEVVHVPVQGGGDVRTEKMASIASSLRDMIEEGARPSGRVVYHHPEDKYLVIFHPYGPGENGPTHPFMRPVTVVSSISPEELKEIVKKMVSKIDSSGIQVKQEGNMLHIQLKALKEGEDPLSALERISRFIAGILGEVASRDGRLKSEVARAYKDANVYHVNAFVARLVAEQMKDNKLGKLLKKFSILRKQNK